jgi:hypothetical protein
MQIKNIFLVLCLMATQTYAMESEKLVLPTNFYKDVLKEFVQEKGYLQDASRKNEILTYIRNIKDAHVVMHLRVNLSVSPKGQDKMVEFLLGYQKLITQLVWSSDHKFEGCYVVGEELAPWEANWNLEQLTKEEYHARFLSKNEPNKHSLEAAEKARINGKKHAGCRDMADLFYGDNADTVRSKIFAMDDAEQEVHKIMLDLLQQ